MRLFDHPSDKCHGLQWTFFLAERMIFEICLSQHILIRDVITAYTADESENFSYCSKNE
jgi:hypothetical protein